MSRSTSHQVRPTYCQLWESEAAERDEAAKRDKAAPSFSLDLLQGRWHYNVTADRYNKPSCSFPLPLDELAYSPGETADVLQTVGLEPGILSRRADEAAVLSIAHGIERNWQRLVGDLEEGATITYRAPTMDNLFSGVEIAVEARGGAMGSEQASPDPYIRITPFKDSPPEPVHSDSSSSSAHASSRPWLRYGLYGLAAATAASFAVGAYTDPDTCDAVTAGTKTTLRLLSRAGSGAISWLRPTATTAVSGAAWAGAHLLSGTLVAGKATLSGAASTCGTLGCWADTTRHHVVPLAAWVLSTGGAAAVRGSRIFGSAMRSGWERWVLPRPMDGEIEWRPGFGSAATDTAGSNTMAGSSESAGTRTVRPLQPTVEDGSEEDGSM